MAETAAHLVDHVFPSVGVRQWVISFPFQTLYHGCLAPHAKIRSLIVPKPETPKISAVISTTTTPNANNKRMTWTERSWQEFSVSILGAPTAALNLYR